ncbi:aliphatic sulfonate ABC transporter substrate-binding protein [Alsobacter metallidurans]|uniref:Aliphatic sulfonate ABC transporter substrate-binding protein n=1 Tax=Alsobacter metallidurans TaxID=340221 RepID=A0A917MKJ7_9HYPH|nr:ABC transporter substrate-binding protein [Alsobacter metallidurans]GGH24165.1 aliphatic sulfonate ABC transporter substrate-binding protein [Alsobacter metallidurans]
MIGRRDFITGTLAGVALGAAGQRAVGQTTNTLPIKVGVSTSSEFVVIYYGVEAGIFAKHGLDAKPVSYPSGVEMVNGLIAGAQDVNTMGSLPFLSGVARGFPIVLIGHLHGDPIATSYAPNQSIVAAPNLKAAPGDLKALIGKTVGMPRGASAEGYLRGMMRQNKIADDQYKLVNLAPPNMIASLRGGDVDAIAVWEPWAEGALRAVEGTVRLSLGGCDTCYDPGTILTTKALTTSKAEELRRFMLAVAECQQWVRANKAGAAVDVAMRWIPGLTPDAWRAGIPIVNYDQRISKRTLENYMSKTIPDLASMGVLRNTPDMKDAIDPQFTRFAQEKGPQFFSDLAPIPADLRV